MTDETEMTEPLAEPASPVVDVAPVERSRRGTRWFLEWALIVVVALGAAFVMRAYVFQTFYIPSSSMVPTLQIGDRIVVSKLSVEFGTIHTGDIVVFKRPPAENCGGAQVNDLVKRVIGTPGDHLYSVGNTIMINGKPLNQSWSHTEPLGPAIADKSSPYVVPRDSYYMIGDNQSFSCDSRYWGPVQHSYIVGKAFLRIWPLSRIGFL